MTGMEHRFGVLDLGSNSVRLLVAKARGNFFYVCRQELAEVRLGEGLLPGGKLSLKARKRTFKALALFFDLMQEEGVTEGMVVATSAVREAADGEDFLGSVKSLSPYPVRLLTPKEEAYFGFRGVLNSMKAADASLQDGQEELLVVDLGGRSTEISWFNQGQFFYRSLSFGAVSLYERYLHGYDPANGVAPMKKYVEEQLSLELDKERGFFKKRQAVALGGTITTLAALEQSLFIYDVKKIHGYFLSIDALRRCRQKLLCSTLDQRRLLLPFAPRRADILPAGAAALLTIAEYLQLGGFTVCEEGLLFGLLEFMATEKKKKEQEKGF